MAYLAPKTNLTLDIEFVRRSTAVRGSILRAYIADEHIGSARVEKKNGVYFLYAYIHEGERLGRNARRYRSLAEWLDCFDYDSYKIGITHTKFDQTYVLEGDEIDVMQRSSYWEKPFPRHSPVRSPAAARSPCAPHA